MKEKELRDTLEQLHDELENTPSVGNESRELLQDVMGDIRELLERSDDNEPKKDTESLSTRLEGATVHFEVDHPRLSHAIGRVVDALGLMGI